MRNEKKRVSILKSTKNPKRTAQIINKTDDPMHSQYWIID